MLDLIRFESNFQLQRMKPGERWTVDMHLLRRIHYIGTSLLLRIGIIGVA